MATGVASSIAVPAPQLHFDPAGPTAQLEKPVDVMLGALDHADGRPATANELQKIGAYVYRVATQGGSEEIWNDAEQAWQAATTSLDALAALTPVALAFKAGQAQPWQGVLVAAGQKDKAGAPRYAAAQNGVPVYRLRAFASFKRDGGADRGLSAPSADLRFVSAADSQRFTIAFDTGSAADCTTARIQLRNAAKVATGFFELRASGPEVEIASCDAAGNARASVLINAAGDIELRPAAGRGVIVRGDLEAEHVRYLPAGGTVKQNLA